MSADFVIFLHGFMFRINGVWLRCGQCMAGENAVRCEFGKLSMVRNLFQWQ